MKPEYDKYFNSNRKVWNQKTVVHIKSDFYDVEGFKNGNTSLMPTELKEIGNVDGKTLLHLQCHFGQDTLSWAREGAIVTGVDFSDTSIKSAKNLAEDLKIPADFICSNIYDLPRCLDKQFDVVYTSYGAIGWLPDIYMWAKIVNKFLKTEGTFYMVEFHPYLWMFESSFHNIKYSYFHTEEPIKEVIKGTYADRKSPFENVEYGWNHTISDVVNSLIKNNLSIKSLKEFNFSHYNCFENMIKIDDKKYVFKKYHDKLPYMYSLKATKTG